MLRQGCSLCMLHRTCKNVHGGVRLGIWSMLREHPCLSMHIEPPRTYIYGAEFQLSLRSDEVQLLVG